MNLRIVNHFLICILLEIAATEIRCQEKSKGGLSYEVVLSKTGNGVSNVIVPRRPAVLDKNISSQEIERKLRAAEERRLVSEM